MNDIKKVRVLGYTGMAGVVLFMFGFITDFYVSSLISFIGTMFFTFAIMILTVLVVSKMVE